MLNKRGQVTLFVILAIVIVAGIVVFFAFRNNLGIDSSFVHAELVPMADKIQSCLDTSLEDGAKLIGLQGGYIIPPNNALETEFSYIAYGSYLGRNTLASKTKIENEISDYIELTLPLCFDPDDFPNYEIKTGETTSSVSINEYSIDAQIKFPISVSKGDSSWSLSKEFISDYQVSLGDMHQVAQEIISNQIRNPYELDFSYLNNFDYDISILNEGEDILVYSITDYNLNEINSYTFRFANKIR